MPLAQFSERFPVLIERLTYSRNSGRIAHAYLISGDDEETLKGFTDSWIASCLCESPDAQAEPCGTCTSCNRLLAGTYMYLHQVQPKSKMRTIPIDEIRALEHHLNLRTGGALRIAVLWEADAMLPAAQNAFLKTLEEPHPGTMLLLVTANPAKLLPTIRSRCQLLALRGNTFHPSFPGIEAFYSQICALRKGSGSATSGIVAGMISAIAGELKEAAEERAQERFKQLAAQRKTQMLSEAAYKRMGEELLAATTADYLAQRSQLLSAIHTWFGNEFLRAQGIELNKLPNPEVYGSTPGEAPSQSEARRNLRLAEKLLADSAFNVDETLLFLNFCQSVCTVA